MKYSPFRRRFSSSPPTTTCRQRCKGFEIGGAPDHMTKPIGGAEILARVRTHLGLSGPMTGSPSSRPNALQKLANAQRNLMPSPQDHPRRPRFQVSICQVLKAGGDFYDVIAAGENVVDYLVADASGHDLAASLWTASLKAWPPNMPAR